MVTIVSLSCFLTKLNYLIPHELHELSVLYDTMNIMHVSHVIKYCSGTGYKVAS